MYINANKDFSQQPQYLLAWRFLTQKDTIIDEAEDKQAQQ
jgi:hypothetical protein